MQPGSTGGFLVWMRHPGKGLPYLVLITLTMLAILFLMNFYIANFILERDSLKKMQKEVRILRTHKTLRPLERVDRKQEVVERIDELNKIKASVNRELVGLEKKRQQLLDDISEYISQLENLKSKFEEESISIEKLQLNKINIELELDEIRHNNQPQLEAPLSVKAPSRTFPPGAFHHSERCTMTTCFDLSHCSLFSHFPIYVYHHPTHHYSNLSKAILRHLKSSPLITNTPKKACIYIYLLEDSITSVKELNRRLTSLSFWNTDTPHAGINHLIINTKPTSIHALSTPHEKLQTGKAMIAQESFTLSDFRRDFDVVLPPFGEISKLSESSDPLPMMVPVRRRHLLTFRGTTPSNQPLHNSYLLKLMRVLSSMQHKYPSEDSVFNFTCTSNNTHNHHIPPTHNTTSSNQDFQTCQPDHLNHSTFCLISVLSHLTGTQDYSISTPEMLTRLMAALRSGAVPVLLCSQGSLQLPLEGLVDWKGAVVWLPAPRTTELHYYVRSFIDEDIFEMRKRGRLIYERFFSSLASSLDSLLNYLRTRLQIPPPPIEPTPSQSIFETTPQLEDVPHSTLDGDEVLGPLEPAFDSAHYLRNFSSSFLKPHLLPNMLDDSHLYPHLPFNNPLPFDAKFIGSSFGYRPIGKGWGGSGKEFREALGGDHAREQFTVVMLTYEREAVLLTALSRFKGLPYLNKVIVVWNSPQPPSPHIKWPDIGVTVEVLKMQVNSLNNRFLPFSSITTEAVLSLDDDVHLRHDEIVFAFRVWRQNRDQLVGFPGRFLSFDNVHNTFLYNSNYSCEMSMVLTGAAFIHKYYMHAYTHLMSAEIRSKVDSFLNCEDIAMNFLVSHMSRKPPIKVTSRWTFKCPGCPTTLYNDSTHFEERHHCINAFILTYGYLPLLTTQYRADSILFKTRIPHDMHKCFKYV